LAIDTNVQGKEQKKLDMLSNKIMVNSLSASGKTAVLISEKLGRAVIIEDKYKGKYCAEVATLMPVLISGQSSEYIKLRGF